MSSILEPRHEAAQNSLKLHLLTDESSKVLEWLAAALYGALLDVPVYVAVSGFQYGGDGGTAGYGGRRFRLETKRYADTTRLNERELLGEIDHALARDKALEAWVLVSTRDVSEQLRQSLVQKGEKDGVPVLIVAWEEGGLSSLAALCASNPLIVENLVSAEAGAAAQILAEVAQTAIASLRRDMAS